MIDSSTAVKREFLFYLDGLMYSFYMADIVVPRLKSNLQRIASLIKKEADYENLVISSLLDSWSLVDICHRVRELIQQTPQLPKKAPEIQVFLRQTKNIEQLRHYVQHFRSGIPNLPPETNPLWGALSWVNGDDKSKCHTIFTGTIVDGTLAPSCVYDTHLKKFVHEISLTAYGETVDINSTYQSLKKLSTFVLNWMMEKGLSKMVPSKKHIFTFNFGVTKED